MTQNEIKTFLEKNINLDSKRYQQIIKKYKESKEQLEADGFLKIRRQGSMATKTTIKPKNPEHEYDLDVAVEITNNEYKQNKEKLEISLREKFDDVERKSKCINVRWNNQFNGDFIIMKNLDGHQYIFDEHLNKEIKSDNLNLMKMTNEKFSHSKNDALRDCAKLMKYYLRQHKKTNDLLPSIVQNILIISNPASNSLGYEGQITTTLSNIMKMLNDKIKKGDIIKSFPNPSNGEMIGTGIKNEEDMENIIKVIQDLKINIMENSLRVLNVDAVIKSYNISSSSIEKPWKI